MGHLTYLLGAGASYHSIPIVDSMNDRMEAFYKMLCNIGKPQSGMHVDGPDHISAIPDLYKGIRQEKVKRYEEVIRRALTHQTVDTYARKLHLRRETEKLNLLKEFLCLYFAFEQSRDEEKIPSYGTWENEETSFLNEQSSHIKKSLDDRYDVLFATLLNEERSLPENVSIISWNYDHQLELAYADYADVGLEEAREELQVYPRKDGEAGRVIKLNGSASQLLYSDYKNTQARRLSLEDFRGDIESPYREALSQFLMGEEKKANVLYKGTGLSFAWEREKFQSIAIGKAQEILSKTTELVVIGYSFPNFNRKIDNQILFKSPIMKIHVQCGKGDFENIAESLNDINPTFDDNRVKERKSLTQFYIPKSFLL